MKTLIRSCSYLYWFFVLTGIFLGYCTYSSAQEIIHVSHDTVLQVDNINIELYKEANEPMHVILLASCQEEAEHIVRIWASTDPNITENPFSVSEDGKTIRIVKSPIEEEMELESWMLETIFIDRKNKVEETVMKIEDWMLESLKVTEVNLSEPVEDPPMEIEPWMTNLNEWAVK